RFARLDHFVDRLLRGVDRGDDRGQLTGVLYLEPVQGVRRIGHRPDVQVGVEVVDHLLERDGLHGAGVPATTRSPLMMESRASITRCTSAVERVSRIRSLSSNRTTSLSSPNDSTFGTNSPASTSRVSRSIARGRSITADAATRSGASDAWFAFAP